jgi:hypothetical protein
VISAEDDAAFLQAKERQEDDPIEGEIEEAE